MYAYTNISAILIKIMPRTRRSFDLPAFYPLFDRKFVTEIEAEGDTKAACHRRLVVVEVALQPRVRLDEVKERHELIASLVDRHLCMVEGTDASPPLNTTPCTSSLEEKDLFHCCLTTDLMKLSGEPRA